MGTYNEAPVWKHKALGPDITGKHVADEIFNRILEKAKLLYILIQVE